MNPSIQLHTINVANSKEDQTLIAKKFISKFFYAIRFI